MSKSENKRIVAREALRVLNIDDIRFDSSYQRGVVVKHKKIISDFNPDALGVPVVAEREDGTMWCVDGRQRITALKALGHKTVRCSVFASSGPEQEAVAFTKLNRNRTALTPLELFAADLVGGDEIAWDIKQIVEAVGLSIPAAQRGKPKNADQCAVTLLCVSTLRMGYIHSSRSTVEAVVSIVSEIWPGDPRRTSSDIVGGLIAWVSRRQGDYERARLISRLNATTATKLIYTAALGIGSRNANIADAIERLYRKRK